MLLANFLEHGHQLFVGAVVELDEGHHDQPRLGIIQALFEGHVDLERYKKTLKRFGDGLVWPFLSRGGKLASQRPAIVTLLRRRIVVQFGKYKGGDFD